MGHQTSHNDGQQRHRKASVGQQCLAQAAASLSWGLPIPCVSQRKRSQRHGADPGQAEGREGAGSRVGWDSDYLTGGLPGMGPPVVGLGAMFLPLGLHHSVFFLSTENPTTILTENSSTCPVGSFLSIILKR